MTKNLSKWHKETSNPFKNSINLLKKLFTPLILIHPITKIFSKLIFKENLRAKGSKKLNIIKIKKN